MADPHLEPHERLILDFASEVGVIAAASRIEQRQLAHLRWLAPNNRYRVDVLKRLTKDAGPQGASAEPELGEYVAASGLLHCADGWGYLGRALNAAIMGDTDTALHLAYYAELRAALSALATQGIGIFDDRHVIVGDSGQTYLLRGKRTHLIAWLALKNWAASGKAADALASAIRPHGVAIDHWVSGLPNGAAWDPVGAKWLEMWGVDLGFFAADRVARNQSSYQPTRLGPRRSVPVDESIDFLLNLWGALEPAGPDDPFFTLDRHLLRRSLEAAFEGKTNKKPKQDIQVWEAAVDTALGAAVGGSPPTSLRNFLLRRTEPADLAIVDLASVEGRHTDAGHHLRVLSRAALLLRVSSGSVRRLLQLAGIHAGVIEFWAEGLGEDRGFWAPGAMPAPLMDLWFDTQAAIEDIEVARNAGLGSYNALLTTCGSALTVLGGCERVALWSAA